VRARFASQHDARAHLVFLINAADLRIGSSAAPFTLLRGKVSIHGATLIVDLEGWPFGSYVFTGQRRRD
jgi:hypothetical protein